MDYVLFEARHEVPANQGALCQQFDFATRQVVPTALYNRALEDEDCRVYVTGLTPALTAFIRDYTRRTAEHTAQLAGMGWGNEADAGRRLRLLHFDREKDEYWSQDM